MAIQIKKAVKYGAKLRLALYGPSGSGKTYTALAIARSLAEKRICVIDTERGSASKYAGDPFDFDVIELESFHPNGYIEAIRAVVQAGEYDVLVIDSASHEWEGSRGALELAGRDFTNWATVTPLHNKFIDAMLATDIHVIATMRAKEEHVMEKEEGKKAVIRKMGMEPIQRKGMQYEFDIVGSLSMENVLTVEKTRCSGLKDQVFAPGNERKMVDILKVWLGGDPAPIEAPNGKADQALHDLAKPGSYEQHHNEAKPTVDAAPAAQPQEPQYPDKLIRLLSEFKTLEPAWCKRPNWDRALLEKVLDLRPFQPFPTEFDDDDLSRVDLYVASVRAKHEKASAGAGR